MNSPWGKRWWRSLLALVLSFVLVVAAAPATPAQSGPADAASETVDSLLEGEDGTEQPAAPAESSAPAEVRLDGEVLFVIRTKTGLTSPQERADAIAAKLRAFARDRAQAVESLQVVEQDGRTLIVAGEVAPENTVLAIAEADADSVNSTSEELAQAYLEEIQTSVIRYRRDRTPANLLRALAYTLLATVALLFFLLLVLFGLPRFYRRLRAWQGTRIPSLHIRNFQLLSAKRVTDLLIAILQVVQLAIAIAVVCLYLVLCFGFFPWSRQVANTLQDYLFSSLNGIWLSFVNYLPNLLTIAVIGLLTYYAIKFTYSIFHELEQGTLTIPGFYREWAKPTYRLVEIFIFTVAAVIAFPYLPGFGSPAFQGLSIFIGILVSLGSTTAVANAVAGIILIYTRAFQVGDRVEIADVEGIVDEKLFLVTRIRTPYNVIVTLPNALLLSGKIVNYNSTIRDTRTPLILTVIITLGYDVPWEQVYETLVEAALATENILEEPSPFVLQKSLGDFSVAYELNAYTRYPTRKERIHSALLQNIQDYCNAAGIEILSPQYSAVRDGNMSTIPENYLPDDYAVPGFQLNPMGNLFQIDFKMGATTKPTNGNAAGDPSDRPSRS